MTSKPGFGKTQPQPKPSKRVTERAQATKSFEKMKTEGVPEFEVYIRIQGKKNWYPVGAIAVKRSAKITHAIFDSEQQLLQGAFRLFPILRKNQNQLEYGYRLKEFKDEPIQLAERPKASSGGGVKAVVSQIQSQFSSLFKRG